MFLWLIVYAKTTNNINQSYQYYNKMNETYFNR